MASAAAGQAATASIVTVGGQVVSWRECAPHSRCKTLGGNPAVSHTRCTSYQGKPGPQSWSWFPGNFLSGGQGAVHACVPATRSGERAGWAGLGPGWRLWSCTSQGLWLSLPGPWGSRSLIAMDMFGVLPSTACPELPGWLMGISMPPEVQVWGKQPAWEMGPMSPHPTNWISNPWMFTNTLL